MSNNDVGVYYDSDTSHYHLSQLRLSNPLVNYSCTDNLQEFQNFNCGTKIALLHIPFPFEREFEDLVANLACDHIFIIGTELHPPIIDFIKRQDSSHITYYLCGFINFDLANAQVRQYIDWFETSTYFYKHHLPEILGRLNPYETKEKPFDILLGRRKQHRDFVYERAVKNPGRYILTYFNDYNTNFATDPDKWQWEMTGVKITKQPEWTVDRVEYFGFPISISQIVPISIYNKTAYSVIAETCPQDHFSFYTEKTSKPIIARRLFVMFAGRGYLANLQKLGFQTFSSIIDESYDQEPDALLRWGKAWDQVRWLSEQSQQEILERARPIMEHNFNHMMSTNWYGQFNSQLEQDFVRVTAD
jgi:hypothetical protein